jgi:hypothetical protein
MKPETLGASELTYEKFFEMECEQSNCTKRGLPVVAISCKALPDFARFSSSLIRKVFKPNIFEFFKAAEQK